MSLNLRDAAFVARLTPAASPPGGDLLLAEMKYTGYTAGQLVNNGTSIDGFTTWADYGLKQAVVASPYGTALKAARFCTSGEGGGSNNSRYVIQLRVPRVLRGSRARIKFKVFLKSPSNGNFCGQTGDGVSYLFWWGSVNVRATWGAAAANGLRIYTGSTQRAELAYTYAADTWYTHTYDVKMDASAGFVDLRVEKADGTGVGTLRWDGETGAENDTHGWQSSWGADASVHGFSSTTTSSSDTACFPVMGPILLHDPAA